MKHTLRNIAATVIILTAFLFSFSSCHETHYYHSYNHHTRGWYERRNVPPPAGVNFEVDVETRHRRHHRH
jgi:hypothetical protein